jgi:hypothetical protein
MQRSAGAHKGGAYTSAGVGPSSRGTRDAGGQPVLLDELLLELGGGP